MKFKLRKFRKGDEESLRANINDITIYRNTSTVPYPYTKKHADQWVKRNLKLNRQRNPAEINFVIEIEGEVAGSVGLTKIDRKNRNAELGYWLGKEYRNQGVMTKAVNETLKFGFSKLKLKRIDGYVFSFNKPSQKVMEKVGLKKEGFLRSAIYKDGKYLDLFLFAKIK